MLNIEMLVVMVTAGSLGITLTLEICRIVTKTTRPIDPQKRRLRYRGNESGADIAYGRYET